MHVRNGMIVRKNKERRFDTMDIYKIVRRPHSGKSCIVRKRLGNGVFGEPFELDKKEFRAIRPVIR